MQDFDASSSQRRELADYALQTAVRDGHIEPDSWHYCSVPCTFLKGSCESCFPSGAQNKTACETREQRQNKNKQKTMFSPVIIVRPRATTVAGKRSPPWESFVPRVSSPLARCVSSSAESRKTATRKRVLKTRSASFTETKSAARLSAEEKETGGDESRSLTKAEEITAIKNMIYLHGGLLDLENFVCRDEVLQCATDDVCLAYTALSNRRRNNK